MSKSNIAGPDYVEPDDVSVNELFVKAVGWVGFLRKKLIAIILIALVGAGIGIGYAFSEKTQYTASLTFALEEDKTSGGGLSSIASQFGFDMGSSAGGAFSGGNLYELMKSKALVEKTLLRPMTVKGKNLSFVDYYIDFNHYRDKDPFMASMHFPADSDKTKLTVEQNEVLGSIAGGIIAKNLSIAPKDRKTTITNVEVTSIDQLFSKYFAEALVKEVSRFYVESKSKKARINVEILERQIDSIRGQLNNSIAEVASATDNTYNLNPALNIKRVPSTRRQIDVQANTAMLTQFVQSLVMARISLLKETPLIQIIDLPSFPLKKVELSKIKAAIIGGFVGGMVAVAFFLLQILYKNVMQRYRNAAGVLSK